VSTAPAGDGSIAGYDGEGDRRDERGTGAVPRAGTRFASRLTVALTVMMLAGAVFASAALGHAKLLESRPKAGQVLERSPRAVVLVLTRRSTRSLCSCRCRTALGAGSTVPGPTIPAVARSGWP
jgi:hypothetical protein